MRYVFNGSLKEYMNKRCTDKTRTKLTETTLTTPTSIRTNKTKHRCRSVAVRLIICKLLSKSLGGKSFYSIKFIISWSKSLKINSIFLW